MIEIVLMLVLLANGSYYKQMNLFSSFLKKKKWSLSEKEVFFTNIWKKWTNLHKSILALSLREMKTWMLTFWVTHSRPMLEHSVNKRRNTGTEKKVGEARGQKITNNKIVIFGNF